MHPKFTATITKFKTEMVKNAPSEPLAKALAQAQGGGRDSTGGVGPGGAVQPPPSPASATSKATELVPPPTPSQQQESTWCPTHATGKALGFAQAGDTLPLTHIQTVVTPTSKHQTTPPPQILPHAKAQGPTPSLSMVGGQEEERERENEHSPLSTPDRITIHQESKVRQPGDLEKQSAREPVDLGHDPGPRETAFQNRPESQPLQILLDIVNRTVWDQEIFKFHEMDGEIRRIIRIEIAEEKSISAKARLGGEARQNSKKRRKEKLFPKSTDQEVYRGDNN